MNLKYRKKPVVIEAFQMTKERRISNADWPEWMLRAWQLERETPGSLYPTEKGTKDGNLSIGTLEGQHLVSWGDWIIQGIKGELYPCKPDIFDSTYETAETRSPQSVEFLGSGAFQDNVHVDMPSKNRTMPESATCGAAWACLCEGVICSVHLTEAAATLIAENRREQCRGRDLLFEVVPLYR